MSTMMQHLRHPAGVRAECGDLVIAAVRGWRHARDDRRAVQPCLAELLAGRDCVVLAPVLDSLLRFYEAALGRAIVPGGSLPSPDEMRLVALLEGSPARDGLDGGRALECALCSARIMLDLALQPITRTQPPHSAMKASNAAL